MKPKRIHQPISPVTTTKTARVEIRVTPEDKARLAEIKRRYGKTPADLLQEAIERQLVLDHLYKNNLKQKGAKDA